MAAWHFEPAAGAAGGLLLRNDSRLPIHNVSLGLAELNDDTTFLIMYNEFFKTLPPGVVGQFDKQRGQRHERTSRGASICLAAARDVRG